MTYWVEIRATVHRKGQPKLVPLGEVANYSGFRTIVAYDPAVAELIREQGGTQGLRGLPVYADTLFMDFDNHRPEEFLAWLAGSGLAHEIWDSGGRSVHVHIPLAPVFGTWITSAMRCWAKTHAPTADVSFYHNAGMYRLPGTFHAKYPGRQKLLIDSRSGARLELQEPAKKGFSLHLNEKNGIEELFLLLTQRKGEGHRQPHIWRIATAAAEAGLGPDEALDHLRWWNERFCDPPHGDEILQRQCESAYRRLARREA